MTARRFQIVLMCSVFLVAMTSAIAQTPPPPTPLAIEVHFANGITGYGVAELAEKHGAWYGYFPRVPGWVAPANSLPVTAVRVESQRAEDGVRVWVSVILGKVHEDEKQVTAYLLHEGDKVSVKELAEVGVVPIEIRILRFVSSGSAVPEFRSTVPSIDVVSIRPNSSAMPSVQMVLRNVSVKPVYSVEVVTVRDGIKRLLYQPQGKEGEALMTPGETFELKMVLESRAIVTANSYQPQQLPNQTIQIGTSVFTDGSYEGNYDYAMGSVGVKKGRKIQLARVIDLLERAVKEKTNATSLKDKLTRLNIVADPAAIGELRQQFPQEKPIGRSKILIEIGLVQIRDGMLKELVEFEIHGRYSEPTAFTTWLTSTKERYQAWLNRM